MRDDIYRSRRWGGETRTGQEAVLPSSEELPWYGVPELLGEEGENHNLVEARVLEPDLGEAPGKGVPLGWGCSQLSPKRIQRGPKRGEGMASPGCGIWTPH